MFLCLFACLPMLCVFVCVTGWWLNDDIVCHENLSVTLPYDSELVHMYSHCVIVHL